MTLSYGDILGYLVPGCQYSLRNGDDYSTLEWIGPGTAPTLEQVETARAAAEAARAVPEQNRQTILQQAAAALTTNNAYLARTSPTTAQNTAQLQALTRQNNKLIRLLAGLLDGTD